MKYALKYCAIFLASLVGMALLAVVIFVNSQRVYCETGLKYLRAEKAYPDLNYVTVNDLAAMLKKDTADFKIVAFSYGMSPATDSWEEVIRQDLIPKWQGLDTTRVSFYLVIRDCSVLSEVDKFVKKTGFNAHTFVIRDNSKEFRRYGRIFSDNRLQITDVIRRIAPSDNADMLNHVSIMSSMVLNKDNDIKLVHLYSDSPCSAKSTIVPMNFQTIESLDSLDFKQIDDFVVTEENCDETWYWCYFSYND